MCGLVGAVGTLTHSHKKMMKDLLFLDTLRGKDSTGVSAIKRDRGVVTRKMTVPGYEFVEMPWVDRDLLEHNDQLWIGHNRFRTHGLVNKFNAHPFEVLDSNGDIVLIGAHNGTLTNKYEVEKELGEKFDTDSEGLFNLLTYSKDYKEAVSKMKGAWSLVWWDAPQNTLHFLRNKERPMNYAYSEDKKCLFWASEAWMLYAAAQRNDVKLDKNANGLSCYSTIVDRLYSLEIPQKEGEILPEMVGEGGYSGAPEKTFQKGGWASWWEEREDSSNVTYITNKSKQEEGSKDKEEESKDTKTDDSKIVTLGEPRIRGYKGEVITLTDFENLKELGCVWCAGEIKGTFAFLSEKEMVCQHCLKDTHSKTELDEEEDYQKLIGQSVKKNIG